MSGKRHCLGPSTTVDGALGVNNDEDETNPTPLPIQFKTYDTSTCTNADPFSNKTMHMNNEAQSQTIHTCDFIDSDAYHSHAHVNTWMHVGAHNNDEGCGTLALCMLGLTTMLACNC
mgnify:CR=1 FL=1